MQRSKLGGLLLLLLGLGSIVFSGYSTWSVADQVFQRFRDRGRKLLALVEGKDEEVSTRTRKGVPFKTSSYSIDVSFDDPKYGFRRYESIEHFVSGAAFERASEGTLLEVLYEPDGTPELLVASAPEAGLWEMAGMLAKIELNDQPQILISLILALLLTPIGLALTFGSRAPQQAQAHPQASHARQ